MAIETTDRERVRYKALEESTMCGAFQVTAAERADAVAIRTKGDELTITWGEYADRVKKLAAGLAALGREAAGAGLSVSHWDVATRTAHARVFAGDVGVAEDPATGSAALGLGAYLVAVGLLPADGASAYTVVQGVEIGRPSTLECSVVAAGGIAIECRVAGRVVPVATGELTPPAARDPGRGPEPVRSAPR
jgi:predicted PhzF superfamily epimerase YddE/YHI9